MPARPASPRLGGKARALLLALLLAAPLAAQSPSRRAFETFAPVLALTRNLDRGSFHQHWSPGAGIAAGVEFPFYAGQGELGVDQMRFTSREPGVPGFRARYFFVGWGIEAGPIPRLALKQGLRVGNYTMHFDDPGIPASARHESEMAVELVSRVAWRAVGPWRVAASGQYRVVLTEPLIRYLALSAGVSRSFTSPRWLRDFLD